MSYLRIEHLLICNDYPNIKHPFETNESVKPVSYIAWSSITSIGQLVDVVTNNLNYYVQQMIVSWGATNTLLAVGMLLAFMTMLKTLAYFLSSASIIPIRTGGGTRHSQPNV